MRARSEMRERGRDGERERKRERERRKWNLAHLLELVVWPDSNVVPVAVVSVAEAAGISRQRVQEGQEICGHRSPHQRTRAG